jgi:outer membrane protein OmpA-like peptidoglycan-associated protein
MNSKSLVLIAFAAWSGLSWYWYVCGIKQACGDRPALEASTGIEPVPDLEPDTVAEVPDVQPVGPKNPTTVTPAAPISSDKMDRVQMETVQDRMVIHFPYKSVRREDNDAIDDYLNALARQLIASGEKVSITGHTDFVGEPKDNQTFGMRRALSIRDALVKKGVPKAQIRCKSFGDRKPVATNDTPYGRYLNRRAEIRVGK